MDKGIFFFFSSFQTSNTLPRVSITFPNLTVPDFVGDTCCAVHVVNFSPILFVFPYSVEGSAALSVLIFRKIFGLVLIIVLIIFTVPLMFVSIVSIGLYSVISIFFTAAT